MAESKHKKVCVRFTLEQIAWIDSKCRDFYSRSDLIRDLVDFTRGDKEDYVDAARRREEANSALDTDA